MKKIRLNLLKTKMPSLNQWMNWHWAKKRRFKDDLAKLLWGLLLNELGTLDIIIGREKKKKITMFRYYDNKKWRKYDHDNYVGGCGKPLMDCFKMLEVIREDNPTWLEHGKHEQIKDKKNPRFEVEIEW